VILDPSRYYRLTHFQLKVLHFDTEVLRQSVIWAGARELSSYILLNFDGIRALAVLVDSTFHWLTTVEGVLRRNV
jgi:hypothetical protein